MVWEGEEGGRGREAGRQAGRKKGRERGRQAERKKGREGGRELKKEETEQITLSAHLCLLLAELSGQVAMRVNQPGSSQQGEDE